MKSKDDILKDLKQYKKTELCDILADKLYEDGLLAEEYQSYMSGNNEVYYAYDIDEPEENTTKQPQEINLLTPIEIKAKLDETVIGQEETKIRIATEVFKHYLKIKNENTLNMSNKSITKSNILLTGLTGTGKTFIMQEIAKILDVPIYIQDCTTLTCSGYVGADIENALKGLLQDTDWDVSRAENGIVVLDEFDKLSRKSENPSITRDVSGESVQQGMLKMLEGTIMQVPDGQRKSVLEKTTAIDTKNILFVACGSFEGIEQIVKQRINKANNKSRIGFGADIKSKNQETPLRDIRLGITREDLRLYGILPEILGRFSILSNLHPLEVSDLVNILKNDTGIFSEYETEFGLLNKRLIVKEEVYEYIAEKAIKENVGGRGLKAIVEDLMFKTMFEMPSSSQKEYVLDLSFCNKTNKSVA